MTRDVMAFMGEVAKAANVHEFFGGRVRGGAARADRSVSGISATALIRWTTRRRSIACATSSAMSSGRSGHARPNRASFARTGGHGRRGATICGSSLASIGGLSGLDEKSARADRITADARSFKSRAKHSATPRFKPMLFHLPHENKYDKAGQQPWKRIEALDKRVAMQVWSAISHFNEIWAAEVPASVMYELSSEPWDFYLDLVALDVGRDAPQHDGLPRDAGLGLGCSRADPYGNALYNALAHMPPAQRLALLYFYEEGLAALRHEADRDQNSQIGRRRRQHSGYGLRLGGRGDPRQLRLQVAAPSAWRRQRQGRKN